MSIYCTLFDINYLTRGVLMHKSLLNISPESKLYIFAFDDVCFETLSDLKLKNTQIISLKEFEDEKLLSIKPSRTKGEYCWTCTSSTIKYVLEHYNEPHCIYVDADLYFYNNPQQLLDEIPTNKSVMITEHRYTKQYDQSKLSGVYCVQFMYFRNDKEGMKVLNWWRNECINWCYNRHEDGKFGDQKYLDNWTTQFDTVWVMLNEGGGLAPWNIQQYTVLGNQIINNKTSKKYEIVFFHFHGVKWFHKLKFIYAPKTYILTRTIKNYFYIPYCKSLVETNNLLSTKYPILKSKGIQKSSDYWKQLILKGNWGFIKSNLLKI